MVGRQDNQQAVADHLERHEMGVYGRSGDKPRVQAEVEHPGQDRLRVPNREAHRDARVALLEPIEEAGDVVLARRTARADPQLARPQSGQAVHRVARAIDEVEDPLRKRVERVSRVRQDDPASRPVEQGHPQVMFEPPDLLGDRGLADPESLRGFADALVQRDQMKRVQRGQRDGAPLPVLSMPGASPRRRVHRWRLILGGAYYDGIDYNYI